MMNVSVIIPAYNVEDKLTRAVESALMQPEVLEVIIVEDCSTDGTRVVCDDLAQRDQRIVVVRNDINRGAATSRNIGIRQSSCECLAFLDADDYYLPSRFTEQLDFLTGNKHCDGVYSPVAVEVESDSEKDWVNNQIIAGPESTSKLELIKLLSQGECWHFNGFVIRKSAISCTDGMNAKLRLGQDLEWFIRLSVICELKKYGSVPVACYTRHQDNRSGPNRQIHMISILDCASKWLYANHYKTESLIVRNQFRNKVFESMQIIKVKNGFVPCSKYAMLAAWRLPSVLTSRLFWERLLS